MKFNLADIARLRLQNLQVSSPQFTAAGDLLNWLGAVQAQDYSMSKYALGLRLPGTTDLQIESALDAGEIFRTHVMRPTWHLVSSADIFGMLELTAPRIKASAVARHKELGLTAAVFQKSQSILQQILAGNQHLSREEISPFFEKAKITTNENRLSHIFMMAEIDGLICSGKSKGKQRTYALLDERAKRPRRFSAEKTLQKLSTAYFRSHGPATIADFTWWSGLSPADARKGLSLVQDLLDSAVIGSETYWFDPKLAALTKNSNSVFLLPAFDEFIVSYKDRAAALALPHHKKVISENGLFRPVIVVDGQVNGIWKRTISKKKLLVEIQTFQQLKKGTRVKTDEQAEILAHYLQLEAEIKYSSPG